MTQQINNPQENPHHDKIKIFNKTKNCMIADEVAVADTFITRMVGLLGRGKINRGEGLLITRCNSIHMFFMRFSIDAIFVDKSNFVVGLVKNIKPWRLSSIFFKASYVVELPPGVIDNTHTAKGDEIQKII